MLIGVPRESFAGERRVALVPSSVGDLAKRNIKVRVESGAGMAAGYPDSAYQAAGAEVVAERRAVFEADVIAAVRVAGANPARGHDDTLLMRQGQLVIAHAEPLFHAAAVQPLAERGVTLAAMELIPRTTRAQSMDALSSQANLAGYRAVLLAAEHLPKLFAMMMTAAGTIKAAKVLVVGAGVAGLQAIATAKRLGAIVSAYDVRAAVKEQVQSLGARFVDIEAVPPAEGKGGYAAAQSEEQLHKQQEAMARVVAESDVVITTAAIPGRKSPVLVTEPMVQAMAPGSVIVDLAAERGGNCALTEADKVVVKHHVTIVGTTNLPAHVPHDASAMYARNIVNLLLHLTDKQGQLTLNMADEITAGVIVSRGGQVVHPQVRSALKLDPLPGSPAPAAAPTAAAPPPAGGSK